MRTYPLTITAGGTAKINAAGKYFRLITASGALTVRMDAGAPFEAYQGVGVRDLAGFKQLEFSSDILQTVTVAVSQYDIDDNRLSLDSVVSVETMPDYSRTLADVAFQGGVSLLATAGQYNHAGIWNPAGSGVRAVVTGFYVNDYGGPVYLAKITSRVVPVDGYATSVLLSSATLSTVEMIGGPSATAVFGIALGRYVLPNFVGGGNIVLPNPVVVPPGYGLLCSAETVNNLQRVAVSFFEEAE